VRRLTAFNVRPVGSGGGSSTAALPDGVDGLTAGGRKHTGRDEAVRPRTVVYDPDLVRGLPPEVAAPSAMKMPRNSRRTASIRNTDRLSPRRQVPAVAKALAGLLARPPKLPRRRVGRNGGTGQE
jgi:hypothetical protein